MALVNKSQQSKTNKAGNFSGGILKLQVPFLNVARMLLYRIQYNIIESKCQVKIFIRIRMPEKLKLIVYFRLDNFFSPPASPPPDERDEERLENGIRDMFYPAV